jgi:hypothetical protein
MRRCAVPYCIVESAGRSSGAFAAAAAAAAAAVDNDSFAAEIMRMK